MRKLLYKKIYKKHLKRATLKKEKKNMKSATQTRIRNCEETLRVLSFFLVLF